MSYEEEELVGSAEVGSLAHYHLSRLQAALAYFRDHDPSFIEGLLEEELDMSYTEEGNGDSSDVEEDASSDEAWRALSRSQAPTWDEDGDDGETLDYFPEHVLSVVRDLQNKARFVEEHLVKISAQD